MEKYYQISYEQSENKCSYIAAFSTSIYSKTELFSTLMMATS